MCVCMLVFVFVLQYEILSRHCLCKTSSLVPVDSTGGVLTVCMPGNQLVDLILELKLETDRTSVCTHISLVMSIWGLW